MSYNVRPPLPSSATQASTSTNPDSTTAASYHPLPRPIPIPPFERIDIHAIKQELHDTLGEHGLAYWKALNGYLLGQVGRAELTDMVKGWLKGSKLHLHNRLLISLLHNSSTPPNNGVPSSSLSARKRKRVGPDDPDFDIDEIYVEPRARVHRWVVGMTGRDRSRIRRMVIGKAGEEPIEEEGSMEPDGARKQWSSFQPGRLSFVRRVSMLTREDTVMPPLSLSARQLPSSLQLSHRLAQLSKAYNLTLAPDAFGDIGEFMAVGMDAHLGDIFHGLVHFTGKGRPGQDTIRMPKGVKTEPPDGMDLDGDSTIKTERDADLPRPDLESFQTLFNLNPGLHPSASPAVYKLASSHSIAEAEVNNPVKKERKPSLSLSPPPANGISPKVTMTGNAVEMAAKNLLETGLLKLDKGRQSEAVEDGGKKDKKHSWHWKYEDPALILKDVLG